MATLPASRTFGDYEMELQFQYYHRLPSLSNGRRGEALSAKSAPEMWLFCSVLRPYPCLTVFQLSRPKSLIRVLAGWWPGGGRVDRLIPS